MNMPPSPPPTLLNILKYPDAHLRTQCAPLDDMDDATRTLAARMLATMYAANGIGLAAPQVGERARLIVMDVSPDKTQPLVIANPQLTAHDGEARIEEGCLSIPGITAEVPRHASIAVSGMDLHGNALQFEADGMLAICTQHEIDHLNGVLFFDNISRLKRERLLHKYKKLQAQEAK